MDLGKLIKTTYYAYASGWRCYTIKKHYVVAHIRIHCFNLKVRLIHFVDVCVCLY